MTSLRHPLPAVVAGVLAIFLPLAQASGSASSAASDSIGTSVGSLSGSVRQSSQSSTSERDVADGDYRIIEVAALEGEPERVRLQLEPVQAGQAATAFALTLPRSVLHEQAGLVEGATLAARNRPYGVEFSAGTPRRAFFLALHDDWYDELRSVPVRPLT